MSGARLGNRLEALERKGGSTGKVHCFVPPVDLPDAEYEAWAEEQKRGIPLGDKVILVRFVAPGGDIP